MISPMIGQDGYSFYGFSHECPEKPELDDIKAPLDPFGGFDWFWTDESQDVRVAPVAVECCPFCKVNLKATLVQFDAKKWIEEAEYPLGMTKRERRDFRRQLRTAFGVTC